MEKKTMDTLRTMICGELEDIAKKGIVSHENLDILKDLLESAKNLEKIEKYQNEKEEKEKEMDRGYSQRKYYIDADYDPYGPVNSYGRGAMGGNSYGYSMGRVYDGGSYMDGSNSYMYHPGYESAPMYSMNRGNSYARGYSQGGNKQEMINELQAMMSETQDIKVKDAIQKTLNEMNK